MHFAQQSVRLGRSGKSVLSQPPARAESEEGDASVDVEGRNEDLPEEEYDSGDLDKEEDDDDDTRRSRFIVEGGSHSVKKVLAGKARTEQSVGINRFGPDLLILQGLVSANDEGERGLVVP